ncbi:sodium channel protein type 2 subunit alpha [Chrysochromulina tobinii]|uniref:Sodium channel protein type 2 subunit alpha n=1 Tax=Chrysochromulina tobinii TaxID=1460289 RepID=A0A0M0JM15_9EUKA|nr:sodium channel protein type 2 subunit alpha [Chrysochromulina tobinii]|eukprot:KOO27372.1 sodium channel protein type 2 subunit alpha [Chrysochromulina sp. CCMP291]
MAWASPLDEPGTEKQAFLAMAEPIFLYIFTFELVTKMIAYGVVGHEHSYLRDPWCQLDFVVVSSVWLPILLPSLFGNMNGQALRALRPLRALKRVPGMPVLVGSIFKSLPALANVGGIAAFFFIIYAIVGVELFKGVLHYRGGSSGGGSSGSILERSDRGSGDGYFEEEGEGEPLSIDEQIAGYDSGTFCKSLGDTDTCAESGETCYYFEQNPGGGTISFDNALMAMLPIMQAVTADTWTDPMFAAMDAFSYTAWFYFVSAIVIGGMFVVNLFLAVIFDEFMRAQATEDAEREVTKKVRESADDALDVDELAIAELIKSRRGRRQDANSCMICDCTPEHGGCCGWRASLSDTMNSPTMGNVSTGFVIFNLAVMCMPYAGQPDWWGELVELLGEFVTWVFIVEMFLKLLGMGCRAYWIDNWNALDGVIVSLSIAEMVITVLLADTGVNISFLRMLRLLRLLRLLKAWPGLYKIVMAFAKAIPQISNLFVLMFLVMSIFALLGMQAFGGIPEISADSRWHFDYFYNAMLTVFGVFSGGWVDAFQVVAAQMGVVAAAAFFLPCLIIGFFIILNLFVAILLEAFAGDEEEEEEEGGEKAAEGNVAEAVEVPEVEAKAIKPSPPLHVLLQVLPEEEIEKLIPVLSPERGSPVGSLDASSFPRRRNRDSAEDFELATEKELLVPSLPALEGVSLGLFGPESKLRKFCQWLSCHPHFDTLTILLIVVSSTCLAIDLPRLDPDSATKASLDQLNLWLTGSFVLEMLLKIVAKGFLFAPDAYLRSGWNVLDFVIVLISILGLLADLVPAFGQLKSLRILRVLRPLRLLQRNAGMKTIIMSLIETLPSIVEVSAVVLVFHIVFSILGMMLFSGAWGACTDPSITTAAEGDDLVDPLDPIEAKRRAIACGKALNVLRDGWDAFMFQGMDVVGVDVAPERNDASANSIFFLLWIVIGTFVSANLFVGAIVDNFTRLQSVADGSALMSDEQQQWVQAMKASNSNPNKGRREPTFGPQRVFFLLVTSREFEYFVFGVIVLNIAWMALDYDRIVENEPYNRMYETGLVAFTYFYFFEFALKICGLGCGGYFGDGWCRFDFFLVCVAAGDMYLNELMQLLPLPPTLLRVLRIARVLRILQLLKSLKGVRDLVMTLVFAFPALCNVGLLLGIVMFMYAVLGINVFTYVRRGETINEHRNFETLGNAFITLFQCLTGDGWSSIMDDAMINEERGCDPKPLDGSPSDCGSPLALPYFVSFVIVGNFIFLNLVVAVIIDNFTALGKQNPDLVSASDILDFKDAWGLYDPDADGKIPVKDLPDLLMGLRPPLGLLGSSLLSGTNPRAKVLRFCLTLQLHQRDGMIEFKKTLDALIKKNYDSKNIEYLPPEISETRAQGPPKMTPRRRGMASVYAEELIADGVINFKRRKGIPVSAKPPSPDRRSASPSIFEILGEGKLTSVNSISPLGPGYREEIMHKYRNANSFSPETVARMAERREMIKEKAAEAFEEAGANARSKLEVDVQAEAETTLGNFKPVAEGKL